MFTNDVGAELPAVDPAVSQALRAYMDAGVATNAAVAVLGELVPSPEVLELTAALFHERTAMLKVAQALNAQIDGVVGS